MKGTVSADSPENRRPLQIYSFGNFRPGGKTVNFLASFVNALGKRVNVKVFCLDPSSDRASIRIISGPCVGSTGSIPVDNLMEPL